MLVYRTFKELGEFLDLQKENGAIIGFVPTMGALHQGHLSLLETSKKQCNITLCSIFVNPTQFNNTKDLELYPRTEESDLKMLEAVHCDVAFLPNVEEVYPSGNIASPVNLKGLDKVMEGAFRPGHFDGVVQVVWRFFEEIQPDKAFFGEKDFQQLAIIKRLVKEKNSKIEIIPCPILREKSGLAMSSRNVRLSDSGRSQAAFIYSKLLEAKSASEKQLPAEIVESVKADFALRDTFKLEYFEICDIQFLQPVSSFTTPTRAFLATEIEGVRLIDNIALNY